MSGEPSPTATAETRKLAAIMFTDIVGFSRQMGADEARMLRLLAAHNQVIEQAIAEAERAIALDPNSVDGYMDLGNILAFAGRPEEAIGVIKKAMRLNPRYPIVYLNNLGIVYRVAGRYEEALVPLKKLLTLNPDFLPPHVNLAACYAESGRLEEAQAEGAEILRIMPNISLAVASQNWPYKDPAVIERYLVALRKAGLK